MAWIERRVAREFGLPADEAEAVIDAIDAAARGCCWGRSRRRRRCSSSAPRS
jgi:hypothetical protein